MPENQNNSVDTELATENSQADVETSETAAPAAGSAPEFTEAPANVELRRAEAAPQADTKTEAKPPPRPRTRTPRKKASSS